MATVQLGIERLIRSKPLLARLNGKRIGLVAHPASVNQSLVHSIDLLKNHTSLQVTCAFGPQHGMRGEKQDNMIESETYLDPVHKIPVFSLYGEVRRPKPEMLEHLDVAIFDLQDLGCRIYTFLTTLLYTMESCAQMGKEVWVLDRPNPAGRPIEGSILEAGMESFVGAGPLPMRHGLTLGEMANWFKDHFKLDLDLTVVPMADYNLDSAPGFGWPLLDRAWVNPSPNAANLNMARCYAGTVLLEGTTLSEGRGTTRPLEVIGSPNFPAKKVISWFEKNAPEWNQGALLRPCYFEPTFHKFQHQLCQGIQIHTDFPDYDHNRFQPYRLIAGMLKVHRLEFPKEVLWRDFHYEYVTDRLAIDVISGSQFLRNWVDDPHSSPQDLDKYLEKDELAWSQTQANFMLYK